MMKDRKICIVGLGYVGLPLAYEFAKKKKIVGFDISKTKIKELTVDKHDSMNELTDTQLTEVEKNITYTNDPSLISNCDFIIVCVPTPIDSNNQPDLTPLRKASITIGKHLSKGSIVVYESTVYPGVTEEICGPILEEQSNLKCGKDFKLGYSPERVNPGDKEHTIPKIKKIVSGQDEETLKIVSSVYKEIITAGIHEASSIKVAEAAKVIENIQRDLNIGLMNELSLIFQKIGINTKEVVEAAGTKWNFHAYTPGLVGGHCIGVDPYYLVYKANALGYHPQIITAARRINDTMHKHVVETIVRELNRQSKCMKNAKILIEGVAFKENVPDIRNSKAKQLIEEFKKLEADVYAYDPVVGAKEVSRKFNVKTVNRIESNYDAVILFSPHDAFIHGDWLTVVGEDTIIYDIKGALKDNNVSLPKNYFSL